MNDRIITDEEKSALLEGVESGAVDVHSTRGTRHLHVEPFAIPQRNCIVSRSFPRMQALNSRLASRFCRSVSALFNDKVEIRARDLELAGWGEFSARSSSTAILFEFGAAPMSGTAVVHVEADIVRYLVESFYGGSKTRTAGRSAAGFTQGEMNVTALFCEELLTAVRSSWQGLAELDVQRTGIRQSNDIVEVIDNGAETVICRFDLQAADEEFCFHLVWPVSMLAPFVPALEGRKPTRDTAEDDRWERVLRARLPELTVSLTTFTGIARLSLRQVANLGVGDIVDIEQPRQARVFAGRVPVIEGRFGVHAGRYALEVSKWLTAAGD